MYDVVYLSSTNKFKNTDKAIFNTLPNTNLLTRQSSFISFIGHTVCLVKKASLASEYNFIREIEMYSLNFFAVAAQKTRSILDFVSLLDIQRRILK